MHIDHTIRIPPAAAEALDILQAPDIMIFRRLRDETIYQLRRQRNGKPGDFDFDRAIRVLTDLSEQIYSTMGLQEYAHRYKVEDGYLWYASRQCFGSAGKEKWYVTFGQNDFPDRRAGDGLKEPINNLIQCPSCGCLSVPEENSCVNCGKEISSESDAILPKL